MRGIWIKNKMVFHIKCFNTRIYGIFELDMEKAHLCNRSSNMYHNHNLHYRAIVNWIR